MTVVANENANGDNVYILWINNSHTDTAQEKAEVSVYRVRFDNSRKLSFRFEKNITAV